MSDAHRLHLVRLPAEVLQNIALHVALLDLLGPPTHLVPFLQTCRSIHTLLSIHNNPGLYADIFCHKFDYRAAIRRLGPSAGHSPNQAWQLVRYCGSLKRIKAGNVTDSHITRDMWTAFVMCIENDGRNYAQLEHANLPAFLDNYIVNRLWHDSHLYGGWPAESTVNSLAIWLLWCTLDEAKIAALSDTKRREYLERIRPYSLVPPRYPCLHAPDNHFHLPLSEEFDEHLHALATPHGFYPPYREAKYVVEHIVHFSTEVELAPPLAGHGARLLALALNPPFPVPPTFPLDYPHALQLGRTGVFVTQADLHDANAHRAVQLFDRGAWDWRADVSAEDGRLVDDGAWYRNLKCASAAWDTDWNRLTGCFDPWRDPKLKGVTYRYGTLTGLWQGLMQVPDNEAYFALVNSPAVPPGFFTANPRVFTFPLQASLREHHCISPQEPVRCGGRREDFDEGLRNGYFPRVVFREGRGRVRVLDEESRRETVYETYAEGRGNSHDPDTCAVCGREAVQGLMPDGRDVDEVIDAVMREESDDGAMSTRAPSEGGSEETANETASEEDTLVSEGEGESEGETDSEGPEPPADPYDRPDLRRPRRDGGAEDCLTQHCSGVVDIIITGETLPAHGRAWNHYRFYGRVRQWDGLVAIVRVPTEVAQLGVSIFRGYITGGKTFVGSWRGYTWNAQGIPLEGPFALSKVDPPPTAASSPAAPGSPPP